MTSDLEAFDAETLTGSIDVSGMTEGEHTVNLELNLDSKFKQVGTATVTVDIVPAGSQNSNNNSADNGKDDEKDPDKNRVENEDSEKKDTESDTE